MASEAQTTRRTRFVCISDTHNCTVKLPKGDVLVHCGDLTNQGSFTELSKQISWLEKADFECKLIIAGNHDMTLDTAFYENQGFRRHNNNPQSPETCQSLLLSSSSLTYLNHEARRITLTSPSGPGTTFTVFGSPWTPEEEHWRSGARKGGWSEGGLGEGDEEKEREREKEKQNTKWAFQYPPVPTSSSSSSSSSSSFSSHPWTAIPPETDILITHGPPYGHLDRAPSPRPSLSSSRRRGVEEGKREEEEEAESNSNAVVSNDLASSSSSPLGGGDPKYPPRRGCPALERTIRERIRPRLALYGHVHEGRGCERVVWGSPPPPPSSSSYPTESTTATISGDKKQVTDTTTITKKCWKWEDPGIISRGGGEEDGKDNGKMSLVDLTGKKTKKNTTQGGGGGGKLDNDGSVGGGSGGSRRETCMVNCAIMKVSYNNNNRNTNEKGEVEGEMGEEEEEEEEGMKKKKKKNGGKRKGVGGPRPMNKPIVVDILLPISGSFQQGEGGKR